MKLVKGQKYWVLVSSTRNARALMCVYQGKVTVVDTKGGQSRRHHFKGPFNDTFFFIKDSELDSRVAALGEMPRTPEKPKSPPKGKSAASPDATRRYIQTHAGKELKAAQTAKTLDKSWMAHSRYLAKLVELRRSKGLSPNVAVGLAAAIVRERKVNNRIAAELEDT